MTGLKKIVVAISLLTLSTVFAAEYDMAEVAKHNTDASCWIVIDKEVFDVTAYIAKHPAPKVILKKSCGTDVSEHYKTKKGLGEKHSDKANEEKTKMKIGTLKA